MRVDKIRLDFISVEGPQDVLWREAEFALDKGLGYVRAACLRDTALKFQGYLVAVWRHSMYFSGVKVKIKF